MMNFTLETAHICWIDVINNGYANENRKFNEDGFLSAKNREYKPALEVCKAFLEKNPFMRETPHSREICIKDMYATSFWENFKKEFKPTPLEMSRSSTREHVSRPASGLKKGDHRITETFYKDFRINLNKLKRKEYQSFVAVKDVIHEKIYGKNNRFAKLKHGYISKDENKKTKFGKQLHKLYVTILDSRPEKVCTIRRVRVKKHYAI